MSTIFNQRYFNSHLYCSDELSEIYVQPSHHLQLTHEILDQHKKYLNLISQSTKRMYNPNVPHFLTPPEKRIHDERIHLRMILEHEAANLATINYSNLNKTDTQKLLHDTIQNNCPYVYMGDAIDLLYQQMLKVKSLENFISEHMNPLSSDPSNIILDSNSTRSSPRNTPLSFGRDSPIKEFVPSIKPSLSAASLMSSSSSSSHMTSLNLTHPPKPNHLHTIPLQPANISRTDSESTLSYFSNSPSPAPSPSPSSSSSNFPLFIPPLPASPHINPTSPDINSITSPRNPPGLSPTPPQFRPPIHRPYTHAVKNYNNNNNNNKCKRSNSSSSMRKCPSPHLHSSQLPINSISDRDNTPQFIR